MINPYLFKEIKTRHNFFDVEISDFRAEYSRYPVFTGLGDRYQSIIVLLRKKMRM